MCECEGEARNGFYWLSEYRIEGYPDDTFADDSPTIVRVILENSGEEVLFLGTDIKHSLASISGTFREVLNEIS